MEVFAAIGAVLFGVVAGHAVTRAKMPTAVKLLIALALTGAVIFLGSRLGFAAEEARDLTLILLGPLRGMTWAVLGGLFWSGGLFAGYMLAMRDARRQPRPGQEE